MPLEPPVIEHVGAADRRHRADAATDPVTRGYRRPVLRRCSRSVLGLLACCASALAGARRARARRPTPPPDRDRLRPRRGPRGRRAASNRSRSRARARARRRAPRRPTAPVVAGARADAAGAHLFRDVAAGHGLPRSRVGRRRAPRRSRSPRSDDAPPQSLYSDQHARRRLRVPARPATARCSSVNVTLPGPGRATARTPPSSSTRATTRRTPTRRQPASRIAQLLGYATVGVNLRGTGCSRRRVRLLRAAPVARRLRRDRDRRRAAVGRGTARSAWSASRSPGITQLFVAATRPPHLAAITPLSVHRRHLRHAVPGRHPQQRLRGRLGARTASDATPRPGGVGSGCSERIADGDDDVRGQPGAAAAVARRARARSRRRRPTTARRRDALAPDDVRRPDRRAVFLAGAWQDEETGGHFANMLDDFAPGIPLKVTRDERRARRLARPRVISRWIEFLDFYVAQRVRRSRRRTRALARRAAQPGLRRAAPTLPPDRFDRSSRLRVALARVRGRAAGPRAASTSAPSADATPAHPSPAFEPTFPRGRRRPPRPRGTSAPTARSPTRRADGRTARRATTYDPVGAAPRDRHAEPRHRRPASAPRRYDWKPVPDGRRRSRT